MMTTFSTGHTTVNPSNDMPPGVWYKVWRHSLLRATIGPADMYTLKDQDTSASSREYDAHLSQRPLSFPTKSTCAVYRDGDLGNVGQEWDIHPRYVFLSMKSKLKFILVRWSAGGKVREEKW